MLVTSSDGVTVNFEVVGRGPALVLCHGSFGSLEDWYDFGYVAALSQSNTLVLIDSRGHGKSAKPRNPSDYSLASRVSDITTVLDALNIERADFMGYSMGGWIGFGLALHAPERCRSLILGGAHPFAEDMAPFRAMVPHTSDEFLSRIELVYGVHLGPAMRSRMLANDLTALRALTTDREDVSNVLATMAMPCLFFAGANDARWPKVDECSRRIPSAQFFAVSGCGHVAAWGRSDLTLPNIFRFLDRARGLRPNRHTFVGPGEPA